MLSAPPHSHNNCPKCGRDMTNQAVYAETMPGSQTMSRAVCYQCARPYIVTEGAWIMKVREGWFLYGANFSAKYAGVVCLGEVSLIRSLEGRKLKDKEGPPLSHKARLNRDFVIGRGETFEAALEDANAKAKEAG